MLASPAGLAARSTCLSSQSGLFRAGAIDLTGDGASEQVQLVDEQVAVYRDGVEVWRGLPGWRVTDLALGDPNGDGRADILLALWKADGEGVPRSHPFIVGYRQWDYRVLWGGPACSRAKGRLGLCKHSPKRPSAVSGLANGERSPADAL